MKRRILKTMVAMTALLTMLTQNAFSAYAAMIEPIYDETYSDDMNFEVETATYEEPVQGEDTGDYGEEYYDSQDGYYNSEEEYGDYDSAGDEYDSGLIVDMEPVYDVPEDARLDILDNQISGSGLDYVDVIINTDELNYGDTFRVMFSGYYDASYSTILNETLDKTNGGTYTFSNLNKEGFGIRVTSESDVEIIFSSDNGVPVVTLRSLTEQVDKVLRIQNLTSQDSSPIQAIDGKGYDSITLKLDASGLSEKTRYTLYVDTDADATVDGEPVKGGIKGLGADGGTFVIEGLDLQEFTAYVEASGSAQIITEAYIDSVADGEASITITEPEELRIKTRYEFSDSYVSVVAELTDPQAVPDDAKFRVTPITSGDAYNAYIEALGENLEYDEEYYRNNTLLYDIGFFREEIDEDGVKKTVEFEPETGSVKISVRFIKSQLSDKLGAENNSDVKIVHLPLAEEILDKVDTALEATDITADDVTVTEVTDAKVDIEGNVDNVTFDLESLSAIGFILYNNNITPGTARSFEDILGNAKYYGVVVDTFTKEGGHSDSNVAANELNCKSGNTNITLGAFTGNTADETGEEKAPAGNPGINIFAEIPESSGSLQVDGGVTYTSNPDKIILGTGASKVYMSAGRLNPYVDKLQSDVYEVGEKMLEEVSYVYTLPAGVNNNDAVLDLTGCPDGTYYIDGASCFNGANHFENDGAGIKINDNQNIVFNYSQGGRVDLERIRVMIGDKTYTSASANSYNLSKHIVYNLPEATEVYLYGVTGIIIAPKALVHGSSSAGWVIASEFSTSNGEWHCVYRDMPERVPTPASTTFTIDKTILINVKDSNENKFNQNASESFTFDLYETKADYYSNYNVKPIGSKALSTVTVDNFNNTDESSDELVKKIGSASFAPLTFDQADTYYFVIYERPKAGWASTETGGEFMHIEVTVEAVTETDDSNSTDFINGESLHVTQVRYAHGVDRKQENGKTVATLVNPTVVKASDIPATDVSSVDLDFENKLTANPGYYKFQATKTFKDGKWPAGATYTIRLVGLDKAHKEAGVNIVSAESAQYIPMPEGGNGTRGTYPSTDPNYPNLPYIDVVVTEDNPVADFGTVVYPYETPEHHTSNTRYDNGVAMPGPNGTTLQYRSYMYKMFEVLPENYHQKFDENGNPVTVVKSFEADAKTVHDSQAEYDRLGCKVEPTNDPNKFIVSYTYDVYEDNNGVSYDPRVQRIKVWVNQTYNSAINDYRAEITVNGTLNPARCGGDLLEVKFENEYQPECTATLGATKEMRGRVIYDDDKFTAVVRRVSAVAPDGRTKIPDTNPASKDVEVVITKDDNGNNTSSGIFPLYTDDAPLKFSQPGTYIYEVSEKKGNIGNVDYHETTIYQVKFIVTTKTRTENGVTRTYLDAEKKIYLNGTEKDSIVLINDYEGTEEISFTAKKTLEGRKIADGDNFRFTLQKEIKGEDGTKSLQTLTTITAVKKSDYTAEAVFDKVNEAIKSYLTFDQSDIGEHVFYLYEENDGATGIEYSKVRYRIVVTLSANPDPNSDKLLKDVAYSYDSDYTDNTDQMDPANYNNTYTPETLNVVGFTNNYYDEDGQVIFKVDKTFVADANVTKTFKFYIKEIKEDGTVIDDSFEPVTITKPADTDSREIASVKFDLNSENGAKGPGTYWYSITEELPVDENGSPVYNKDGVTYDPDNEHKIKVEVARGSNNKLKITTTVDNGTPSETTDGNAIVTVSYENNYGWTEIEGTITGTKNITGKSDYQLTPGQFTFTVTGVDGTETPAHNKLTNDADGKLVAVLLDENGDAVIDPETKLVKPSGSELKITFTKPGTYKYEVTEDIPDDADSDNVKDGIQYPENVVQTVTFNVEDNGAGGLTIKNAATITPADFTNYNADGEAVITATKVFNEMPQAQVPQFSFELLTKPESGADNRVYVENDDDRAASRADRGIRKNAVGSYTVSFDPIAYTLDDLTLVNESGKKYGVFTYYIHEVLPDGLPDKDGGLKLNGITYDNNFYPVTVTVTDNKKEDGKFDIDIAYTNGNTVTNSYSATGSSSYDVSKVMVGRKAADGDKFEIIVKYNDAYETGNKDNKINDEDIKGYNKKATVSDIKWNNGTEGTATFDFTFNQVGTYEFLVTESAGTNGDPNLACNPANNEYIIEFTVTDPDNNGELKAAKKCYNTKDTEKKDVIASFTNVETQPDSINLYAHKTMVTNKTLTNGKFEFTLSTDKEGKVSAAYDNDGKTVKSVTNNGELVTFTTRQYTRDDIGKTYTYYIRENVGEEKTDESGNKIGYHYSRTVYTVDVAVTEDKNNALVITPTYYEGEFDAFADDKYDASKRDASKIKDPAKNEVDFGNEYYSKGHVDIEGQKLINGVKPNDSKAPKKADGTPYTFKFELVDSSTGAQVSKDKLAGSDGCEIDEDGYIVSAEDGKISFTISYDQDDFAKASTLVEGKDSKRIVFYELYEVDPEIDGMDYIKDPFYVAVSLEDNDAGKISADWYEHVEGEDQTYNVAWYERFWNWITQKNNIKFDNPYTADGSLKLSALKTLYGIDFSEDAEFKFILTNEKGKPMDEPDIQYAKGPAAEGSDSVSVEFNEIKFTLDDVGKEIQYKVVEDKDYPTAGGIKGVKYSNVVYIIDVTVADNHDGTLNVTADIKGNGIQGGDATSYTYEATVSSNKETEAEDGTTVEHTKVCEPEALLYENTYDPEPAVIEISGFKQMLGRDLEDGDEFTFTLTPDDENVKILGEDDKLYDSLETRNYKGADTFTFTPKLKYTPELLAAKTDSRGHITEYKTEPVVITYTLKEESYTKGGVTNDPNNERTVVVTVTQSGGQVYASYEIYAKDTDTVNRTFINQFDTDGTLPLTVLKTVPGTNAADKTFNFTLTGEGVTLTASAKNDGKAGEFKDADGKPLTYTLEQIKNTADDGTVTYSKTFEYTITEDPAADMSEYVGYKDFSKEEYKVNVHVWSDGKDGVLHIDPVEGQETYITKVKDKAGNDITPAQAVTGLTVSFVNDYEFEDPFEIAGTKTMYGRELASDDTFEIQLESSKGHKETAQFALTQGLDDDGKALYGFKFDGITFKQNSDGTISVTYKNGDTETLDGNVIYYTVSEIGEGAGVTPDTTTYKVQVTVTDNGSGHFDIDDKVTKDEPESGEGSDSQSAWELITGLFANWGRDKKSDDIEFTNTYKATGDFSLEGYKALIGIDDIEGHVFQFKIEDADEGYYAIVSNNGHNITFSSDIANEKSGKYNGKKFFQYEYDPYNNKTDDIGKHTYKITEVNGGKTIEGVTYDDYEYVIVVDVQDEGNGTLSASIVEDESTSVQKIEEISENVLEGKRVTFRNEYAAYGYLKLAGTKAMKGRELRSDERYEFTITEYESDGATLSTTKTKTVYNDADGRVEFAPNITDKKYGELYSSVFDVDFLKYDLKDMDNPHKKYKIEEKEYNENGVTSSKAWYDVYVDLSLSGETITPKVTKITRFEPGKLGRDQGTENLDNCFDFENPYEAVADIRFTGKKTVLESAGGEDLSADIDLTQFSFKLVRYDNGGRNGTGTLVGEVKCNEDGTFTLTDHYTEETLKKGSTYESPKAVYYRIEEVIDYSKAKLINGQYRLNGIVYTTQKYDVDVEVSYPEASKVNAEGKEILKVEAVSLPDDITFNTVDDVYEVKTLGFTNYQPKVEISGTKYWHGKETDPNKRPDVIVTLYANNVASQTYTIKAPNTTYEFKDLPAVDAAGNDIEYRVEEGDIPGYVSEKRGNDFHNTAGKYTIRKVDYDTGETLDGAELAIYDGDTLVERWTSEISAHVVDAALEPGKTYTLRELSAPEGYETADDMTFTVPSDGSDITVTMRDRKIVGNVRLVKRDSATGEALAGAEFALYRDDGTRIYASGSAGSYTYSATASNGRFAVDSRGELEIRGLPYGTYYFTEITAPSGYDLSDERVGFSILERDTTVDVSFYNTRLLGSVRLRKTNSDGTRSLAGAVFELYARTPRSASAAVASTIYRDVYYRVGTYTTNSAGIIEVTDLPWDDYYFVEVSAPDGYEITRDTNGDTIVYTFTIGGVAGARDLSYDLGGITNDVGGDRRVLGEREREPDTGRRRGGVVSGVLGVRSAPKSGVLGERVGPVTGDKTNILLWVLLLTACISTIVCMCVKAGERKRYSKRR